MRLRQVKLAGFKSFVDPTTIPFPGDLIGIVGPNGCGKSNVIDAVRWVMGEISAKHLRGDTMADVVFTGSNTRKPVGQASVELVFDNTDGRLGGRFASYEEISVRRQVTRESQSTYFLNGARCRRRDVQDVFLGTGLGPRSYSIIEQGMISRLIEAKPDDLREFLEEAAGISKYKERRRETENRIRHTRENLDRLNDLREELEQRLAHLKRQAAQAGRYRKLKAREREQRLQLLALRWRSLDEAAQAHERRVGEQRNALESSVAEQRRVEAELEAERTRQAATAEAYNDAYRAVLESNAEVARTEQSIESLEQRRIELERTLERDRSELEASAAQLGLERERLVALEKALAEAEPEIAAARDASAAAHVAFREREEALHAWQSEWESLTERASEPMQAATAEQTRIQTLEARQDELAARLAGLAEEADGLDTAALAAEVDSLTEQHSQHASSVAAARERVTQAQAKIRQLRERGASIEGELNAARERYAAARGRLASLQALQEEALGKRDDAPGDWLQARELTGAPRLAEKLRVAAGWEAAVEAVLGYWLEAVCVGRLDAVSGIGDLARIASGRVALVEDADGPAADRARPGGRWTALEAHVEVGGTHGGSAIAPALAGVYAASSLAQALSERHALAPHECFVTRDAFIVGPGWCVVARGGERSGVLGRAQELEALGDAHAALEQQCAALEQTLKANRRDLAQAEDRLHAAQAAVSEAVERAGALEGRLASRRAIVEQRHNRAAQIQVERSDVENRLASERQIIDSARSRLERSSAEAQRIESERAVWHERRGEHRQHFESARDHWQVERDRAYEVGLKVESARTQAQSLRAGIGRDESRIATLQTRCDSLASECGGIGAPLGETRARLASLLESRSELERKMRGTRDDAETAEQGARDLDESRQRLEQAVAAERERLSSLQMEGQETLVRRTTLEEQFAEEGLRAAQDAAQAAASPERETDAEVGREEDEQAGGEADEAAPGGRAGHAHQVELSEQLTIARVLAELPPDADEAAWAEELERLERRIARLGPINLAAIGEFEQQTERKTYLDAQGADLEDALATLVAAIQKIDRETRARFKETFEKVDEGIREKFPRLFGGGEASLQLTGDDLLSTGVAVMARPPGKRNASIHLLSGGEKALAAVALVFAIFDLNPAPFCLLDEVDAPLDDSNVARFCDLVREMSERVQFILITHNKITMEATQQLIGVTMNEPGVSRLVAVDLEEAVELAAE